MGENLKKLLSIASDSFSQEQARLAPEISRMAGTLARELEELLLEKNGFFAFEGALRVFPTCKTRQSIGLEDWNSAHLWLEYYSDLVDGCLFFAEDIFGGQFVLKNDSVHTFDPETANLEIMASSLEEWAEQLLTDYNYLTGYPLAHEWQANYGSLSFDSRLMPKVPFVCGGKFELENLAEINSVSSMRSRGNLAQQIFDLPDGAQIEFKIID